MSKPTHYEGVELPELPEPFFWEKYNSTGVRVSAKPHGAIVGALTCWARDSHLIEVLPLDCSMVKLESRYVNTPQEAVPLLVTWVLLGICKEE